MIDVRYNFLTDTPIGKDPDKFSKTLKEYHRILWSKDLPNGEKMELKSGGFGQYLVWKDFDFGSDSIIIHLRYKKNELILNQARNQISGFDKWMEKICCDSYTIGGLTIFPKHVRSMNQMRGFNRKISDRWDLTLECIRRYYSGEDSPLNDIIDFDKNFYELFVDFKGYVDYFFFQDCVSDDYSKVHIWCGDNSFEKNGLPETLEDYLYFIEKEHEFLDKRNKRIEEWCINNNV